MRRGVAYPERLAVEPGEPVLPRGAAIGAGRARDGPDGQNPSIGLSECLRQMGVETYRLKTGTPPRIKRDSIDFSKAKVEPGTPGNLAFSFMTKEFIPLEKQELCYLIYTICYS